ncbi:hypothetical protein PoB_007701200 [Plakobranchus ocellatus]|uniref:Cadherin-like beta-sandwich-like domain-containing protein n=1 Tax=Plakobranchus ocellatus TaxID=259542 RepID=A0AAV4E1L8_9GAST|nr:hypothetical protein PoB_007701200 [Plakobranchus ocellatus]
MDDCTLSKLTVKPGTLIPAFKTDVTEYNVTVASNVEKITLNPTTSDNGASFSISGSGGSRDVPLKEGVTTDIKIEVSSEDNTLKSYFVHVKRLSAKDAVLTDILIKNGHLEPEFNPNQLEYYCRLPCNVSEATITPKAPDPKNAVTVNGGKPEAQLPLNTGLTEVKIEVTSPDGTNKKLYIVEIVRKPIPRHVKFTDTKAAHDFECPISLSPLYCPITVKNSNPRRSYSGPIINELTKISKVDPLTGDALLAGWKIQDFELDKSMATQSAVIPLTYGGSTEPKKFSTLAGHLAECSKLVPQEDLSGKFGSSAETLKRTLEEHKWQKSLQQIFDETNPEILKKNCQAHLDAYYKKLPKAGQFRQQYNDGESPMDELQTAIHCMATALKFKPKDADIHLKLAMLLEEKYLAEDMFGLKKEEKDEAPSLNLQAKESSKEEEVFAICKLKGIDESAPVSHHLKALDNEYHHLLDSGQSGKADHVQSLYVWYSKKVSQEGAAAHKAEDNESPLGQAYQKYLDALCIDESKAVYNFHVGRLLVVKGNYEEAVKRLEATLSWNSQHEMARFYLGLAISLSKKESQARGKEAIKYLLAGMELLLSELSKQANTAEETIPKAALFAENLVRTSNVYLLRGIIQLGNLLTSNEVKDAMSSMDVFHTAALLATQVLPTVCRGDVYKQIEWILVDAHSNLLEILIKQKGVDELIASRCQRLSALIFNSTISGNYKLLELQEATCQKLVKIQPSVSYSLFLLGSAQFALYENTPKGEASKLHLQDAENSFKASIALEGKTSEEKVLDLVTNQRWWMEFVKKEEEAKKASSAPVVPPGGGKVSSPPANTTAATRGGRGGAAAAGRGRGGQPAAASTTQAKGDKSKHVSRGNAAARGAPAARGGAAARGGKAVPAPNKKETPPAKQETPPATEPAKEAKQVEAQAPKVVIKNVKSYPPRLGLARVLRAADQPDEAKKFYAEVIDMAPEIHDAYIESAEMLAKSSPLEAADVYSKFPVSENPNFDDAFIFGEIVRILMKAEKFDDERLAKNMIAYGKVLGAVVLERYTKILEQKNKNELLRKVYAGLNNKSVDDPDMQAFFKFKFWI